ncbi:c-type cytochrome [Kordiimonas sp.]|uniref:c-type cytochrome n=1 Tax=Kordiimonas sp. TaxID=1970157 RepID=UPI003A905A0E
MNINKTGWLLAGAITFAGTVGVLAHGGATGIVKDRMDGMMAMGDAVKSLSDMFRAGTYDAETVKAGAAIIKQHSGEQLLALFPEGSGGMPSEAKPAVWTDWDAFSGLANDLAALADALSANADNPDGNMPGNGGGMMGGGMSGSSTMGGGMMGGQQMPDAEMLAQMPVEGVFNMAVQTCAACHSKFRIED